MKKKLFLEKGLPKYLCALLCIIMATTVVLQAPQTALTTDEAMHASYGQTTLRWYVTLGRDRAFLNYPLADYEPQHGALFDVVVAAAERIFHHQWLTEALLIGTTGLLSVIAIGLCGLELGGWWFAFLAALSLWLYPRFSGAILNNPKDVPFTMANTFVLWALLLLTRQWGEKRASLRNSLLVAFFLGIAVALRVNAVVWYALLGLWLGGWWLMRGPQVYKEGALVGEVHQQLLAGAIIGIGSFLWMLLLWPYVFLHPLGNLYNAIVVIAKYPWNGSVLYQGTMQLAVHLPRSYAPVWLVIGSPPLLILLALFGLFALCTLYIRKRAVDLPMTLVLLAFALPLSIMIGLHSVLYNGLRQFLFLVPPLILLAIYGFLRALHFCWHQRQTALLLLLLLCFCTGSLWTAWDMFELHPYEYAYFSPLVGGVTGAHEQYEVDYWNTCQRAASVWLGTHYQTFFPGAHPTIQARSTSFQYMPFLPTSFQAVQHDPAFLIDIPPFAPSQELSEYHLIHVESVQQVPLCRVYARNHLIR